MTDEERGFPGWLRRWTPIIAAILIPLAVVYATGQINRGIAEAQVSADYLQLAVDILSGEIRPGSENPADSALRAWAVEILEANSPVALDPQITEALRAGEIVLGTGAEFGLSGSLSDFQASQLPDGSLPADCEVIVAAPVPIYDDNSVQRERIGQLEPGYYQATDVVGDPLFPGRKVVRVEEGWIPLSEQSRLQLSYCFE